MRDIDGTQRGINEHKRLFTKAPYGVPCHVSLGGQILQSLQDPYPTLSLPPTVRASAVRKSQARKMRELGPGSTCDMEVMGPTLPPTIVGGRGSLQLRT